MKLHTEHNSRIEQKGDIILQLNFLEDELKNNDLGIRMQQIFPEGFVFINALYGLAWCELASSDVEDLSLRERAIEEALYAYNCIDSETAKHRFPMDLNPEYGIFYNGWRNYLLSKILSTDTSFVEYVQYSNRFKIQTEKIVNALNQSSTPFLESYEYHSWPADMCVAMASISIHDRIFDASYQSDINRWLKDVTTRLDSETNIIPHEVDFQKGSVIQGARGSSTGLILRMLGEINQDFAHEQFELAKSLFLCKTFGLPSMREYPIGTRGLGDIDSGPVIFGVGFAGTIVMIGTLAIHEQQNLSSQFYKTIHAFGFHKTKHNQKKYLYGKLPIADAFIAWGRATALSYSTGEIDKDDSNWRAKFHLISVLMISFLWMLYYRKRLSSFVKNSVLKSKN